MGNNQDAFAVLQLIGLGLLGWILQKIIAIEVKLTSIDAWKNGHDKQDDDRYEENIGKFDAIFEAVNKRNK